MAESGDKVPRSEVEKRLIEHYQSVLASKYPPKVACRDVEPWEYAALNCAFAIDAISKRYRDYWMGRGGKAFDSVSNLDYSLSMLITKLSRDAPSQATRTFMCEFKAKNVLAALRQPSKKRPRGEPDEEARKREAMLASRGADKDIIQGAVHWLNKLGRHGAKGLESK